jgi:WD40 repeat protein
LSDFKKKKKFPIWLLTQVCFLSVKVFSVDWSPDGEKVASGGKDKVLKLWMG